MGVARDGNWFAVEPLSTPAAAAGAEMLRAHAAELLEHLPLAADRADDDVEHVHHLRVSARRTAAALRGFAPLAGGSKKKLAFWLRKIRRAAGKARDLDVLAARLSTESDQASPSRAELRTKLVADRAQAQKKLARVAHAALDDRFERALGKALRSLQQNAERHVDVAFGAFALGRLADAGRKFADFLPEEQPAAELHGLRIRAKRLRYSIELFHSAADDPIRTLAYPLVEEVQERLGALNDRLAAQSYYQAWLADLPPDELAACVASLVTREWEAADGLRREFLAWYSGERRQSLATALDLG